MKRGGPVTRLKKTFRERERQLMAVFAIVVVLAAGAFAMPPLRHPVLDFAQRFLDVEDAKWTRRVEHAEALVDAGSYEEAVAYLTVLDSVFPARHVKHRRDRERERILTALGKAELALGRNDRALTALRRLVAFDTRNYQNHFSLAAAALQAGEVDEAKTEFESVLAILPSHLPSLQALTGILFGASDYQGVVTAYEKYLKSFQIHELQFETGDTTALIEVPVDENFHDVSVTMSKPAHWRGSLTLETGGLFAEIESVILVPPILVGRLAGENTVLRPAGTSAWPADGTMDQPPAEGTSPKPAFKVDAPPMPDGVERFDLRIRLRKPIDPLTWRTVEKSYRNLLDLEGLQTAQSASYVLRSVDAVQFIRNPE